MGKFVVALVLFELFSIINLSYTHSSIDGYNSLYELAGLAYDDLYPLRRYNSIDPYRFVGLGHSEQYYTGGSGGYSNLGTPGFSGGGGGNGYNNLWRYLIGGSKDLGDYGLLGQYKSGGYNSLYDLDDVDYGNLNRRSLGSYQNPGSRYLGSFNNIGGYSNLGPYNLGGYSIGNDIGLLNYLPNNNRLNEDQYYPRVYPFGNREVRSRPRRKNTYK